MEKRVQTWFIHKNGKWFGPFSLPILAGYFQNGKINAETLVSTSKTGPGAPLHRHEELWSKIQEPPQKRASTFQPKVVSARQASPSRKIPWLAIILILVVFGIGSAIFMPDHPLRALMTSSSLRQEVKRTELPNLQEMVRFGLERGLNFRLSEIRSMLPDRIVLKEVPHQMWLNQAFPNAIEMEHMRHENGFIATFLADDQSTVFAVVFFGPSFHKVFSEDFSPLDWSLETTQKTTGERVLWEQVVLEQFLAKCVFENEDGRHQLKALVVSNN